MYPCSLFLHLMQETFSYSYYIKKIPTELYSKLCQTFKLNIFLLINNFRSTLDLRCFRGFWIRICPILKWLELWDFIGKINYVSQERDLLHVAEHSIVTIVIISDCYQSRHYILKWWLEYLRAANLYTQKKPALVKSHWTFLGV